MLFFFSFMFIVQGKKAFIQITGDLHDLASEIALPCMAGAGTTSLTVLISEQLQLWQGAVGLALALIMLINYLTIMGLKQVRHAIRLKKFQTAFDKIMELLLRINGFFLGAIGVDMVVTGVSNMMLAAGQAQQ